MNAKLGRKVDFWFHLMSLSRVYWWHLSELGSGHSEL